MQQKRCCTPARNICGGCSIIFGERVCERAYTVVDEYKYKGNK